LITVTSGADTPDQGQALFAMTARASRASELEQQHLIVLEPRALEEIEVDR
jgi:hypothetical protein